MNLMKPIKIVVLTSLFLFAAVFAFSNYKKISETGWKGVASYYHPKFNGRKTSSGEVFNNTKLTCANNFLKLGTLVKVTNERNGKWVIVKVNDRMHPKNKRLVDLSQAAASKIGLLQKGIAMVNVEIVQPGTSVAKS